MKWYLISLITLCIYWLIGTILVIIIDNSNKLSDKILVPFCMGLFYPMLLYPILWVLFYPIRSWNTYKSSKHYYQNHNITFLQYLFGKRVNKNDS